MIEIFEIQIYVGDNCESYASRENQNIKDFFSKNAVLYAFVTNWLPVKNTLWQLCKNWKNFFILD